MELSDGIAALVASNDHVQEVISHMEEICRVTEVRHAQSVSAGGAPSWWVILLLVSGERSAAEGSAGTPLRPPGGHLGGAEARAGWDHQQTAGRQAETGPVAHPSAQRRAGGRRHAGGVGHSLRVGAAHVGLHTGGRGQSFLGRGHKYNLSFIYF